MYLPALRHALGGACRELREGGVMEVSAFGTPGDVPQLDEVRAAVDAVSQGVLRPSRRYGAFPSLLHTLPAAETLLVNAWDPHSIAGNGNAADQSLDGYGPMSSPLIPFRAAALP
eukprot:gene40825-51159_t